MQWIYDDGGRAAAGFKGTTRDCVVRAVAIATLQSYRTVYDDLFTLAGKTPRNGFPRKLLRQYLANRGWRWQATMGIGTGCRVHLRDEELPGGTMIVSLSKHIVAVIDGVVRDTYDPCRDGARCVYGYWTPPTTSRP